MSFSYQVQEHPNGLAEAFILGEDFICNDPVALVLCDSIHYGLELSKLVQNVAQKENEATVFGYYFNDPERFGIVEIAKYIQPSSRDELEITDVNKEYLKRGQLDVQLMGRGYAWLDTSTHDSMLEVANFIATIEKR